MSPSTPRRMRSTAVSLGLVGALAIGLTGCGSGSGNQNTARRCVDTDTQVVVEDERCDATTSGRHVGGGYYGYYYGGRVRGGKVSGGSYSAPSGVDTGGFGAKGKGSGGS